MIEETETGFITQSSDLARLNVVDWNRYKSYWKSPMHAVDRVGGCFVGFRYSIWSVNLYLYPEQDKFPNWEHVGGQHRDLGQLFWNFFKYTFDGDLHFHDQPDISGWIYQADLIPQKREFWGDIGKVSPITLLDTSGGLHYPMLWISVIDNHTIVVLEAPPQVEHSQTPRIRA